MVSICLSFANCISRFLFKAICFTNNNAQHTSAWDMAWHGMLQTNSIYRQLVCQIQRANMHIVVWCQNMRCHACVCAWACVLFILNKQNMNFWLCLIVCSCEFVRSIFADAIFSGVYKFQQMLFATCEKKRTLTNWTNKTISCTQVYTHITNKSYHAYRHDSRRTHKTKSNKTKCNMECVIVLFAEV